MTMTTHDFVAQIAHMNLAKEDDVSDDWSDVRDDYLGECVLTLQGLIEQARATLERTRATIIETKSHTISDPELATVIAALRLWQRLGATTHPSAETDIATNGGEYLAIDGAQIDALIDRMNFGGTAAHVAALFRVGDKVACIHAVCGDNTEGEEVHYPPGAVGSVDLIETRDGQQVVHVEFDWGVVNVFEGPETKALIKLPTKATDAVALSAAEKV